jgi:hypothetical protein
MIQVSCEDRGVLGLQGVSWVDREYLGIHSTGEKFHNMPLSTNIF